MVLEVFSFTFASLNSLFFFFYSECIFLKLQANSFCTSLFHQFYQVYGLSTRIPGQLLTASLFPGFYFKLFWTSPTLAFVNRTSYLLKLKGDFWETWFQMKIMHKKPTTLQLDSQVRKWILYAT